MSRMPPAAIVGPTDLPAPRPRRGPSSDLATLLVATLVAVGASGLSVGPVAAAETPVMRTTRLAGPIDVRGGDRVATVAQMPLGAGEWTVLAKGVLRDTTTATSVHPVRRLMGPVEAKDHGGGRWHA